MAEAEPVELAEPVDVVAWLRALPLYAVLLDGRDPERPRCWQVRPWYEYAHCGFADPREFVALVMTGSEEAYELADDEDMGIVAADGPFRVLWTPGGVS